MRQSMQKIGFLLLSLTVLVLLSGCTSTVRTRVSTFVEPTADFGEGTIAVKHADESKENSLEFEFYKAKVEAHLRNLGYRIAAPEDAQYIAHVGLEVEKLEPSWRHSSFFVGNHFGPYWNTGFGPYWDPGLGHYYRPDHPFYRHRIYGPRPYYWGTSVSPRYGAEFARTVSLTISKMPSASDGEPQRTYEVKATSVGHCSEMSVVFDEMLSAIFQNFPGENGAVKTVRVPGETKCG